MSSSMSQGDRKNFERETQALIEAEVVIEELKAAVEKFGGDLGIELEVRKQPEPFKLEGSKLYVSTDMVNELTKINEAERRALYRHEVVHQVLSLNDISRVAIGHFDKDGVVLDDWLGSGPIKIPYKP